MSREFSSTHRRTEQKNFLFPPPPPKKNCRRKSLHASEHVCEWVCSQNKHFWTEQDCSSSSSQNVISFSLLNSNQRRHKDRRNKKSGYLQMSIFSRNTKLSTSERKTSYFLSEKNAGFSWSHRRTQQENCLKGLFLFVSFHYYLWRRMCVH